jgi:hypothetical protein
MKISNHGAVLNSDEITTLLDHLLEGNNYSLPVCIWGPHGVGKTELVKDYCKAKGWNFAYCAPAQFEEMGDLHGMPEICSSNNDPSSKVTKYIPPEWIPVSKGPGILLLDDVNRAEDRILRGLMQLFQTGGLFSWKLPPGWKIVCTANPDNGLYSVTTLDDAMITRMVHLSLAFNAKNWAVWASENGIDRRGIDFVLTYPESVTGKKTTARTLVQFFKLISSIPDLKKEIIKVGIIAAGLLDDTTVSSFLSFVREELQEMISPEEILNAKSETDIEFLILKTLKGKDGHIRVDRISTLCDRLLIYLNSGEYKFNEIHRDNLAKFIGIDGIPKDIKTRLGMEISKITGLEARKLLKNKAIANILLASL